MKDTYDFVIENGILKKYIGEDEMVNIPFGVVGIGRFAFSRNDTIHSILLPQTVTDIPRFLLSSCRNLSNIMVDDANPKYKSVDGNLYSKNGRTLIKYASGKAASTFIVPKTVTTIADSAFENCVNLKSIAFSGNISSIGIGAFSNCTNLTDIVLPSSINKISEYAFNGCTSLAKINIPNSVTVIENYSFKKCSNLTEIHISDNVTSIGGDAFCDCKTLESISIPERVTYIGAGAFSRCEHLANMSLPDSVEYLGGDAFSGCTSLEEINLSHSISAIHHGTFAGCRRLSSIVIPEGVSVISSNAFFGCQTLKSIVIPNSVTNIDENAFLCCTGMEILDIRCNSDALEKYCFQSSKRIRSVPIGFGTNSITWWKDRFDNEILSVIALDNFDQDTPLVKYILKNREALLTSLAHNNRSDLLKKALNFLPKLVLDEIEKMMRMALELNATDMAAILLEYRGNNYSQAAIDTYYEDKQMKKLGAKPLSVSDCKKLYQWDVADNKATITRYIGEDADVVIPALIGDTEVVAIGNSAFYGCDVVSNITIPNGIKSIEKRAFSNCVNITQIMIPDSVVSIEGWAFSGCEGLTDVIVGEGVESIGEFAFDYCHELQAITIPNSVKSIGDKCFRGCTSLTSITVDAENKNYKSIAGNLYTKDGKTFIQYAIGKTDTSFVLPRVVKKICEGAFADAEGLTSVELSESIKKIPAYMFRNCRNLANVSLGNAVTVIENYAFQQCIALENFTVPDCVTRIGEGAFWGCTRLYHITISERVNKIGAETFKDCENVVIMTSGDSFAEKYAQQCGLKYELR